MKSINQICGLFRICMIISYVCISNIVNTWHIRRAVLIARAPDAQLANIVAAPALDTALCHDDACVARTQGNSDGGDA